MWFLRVGINSKLVMVYFRKMLEVAKATGLLFLLRVIHSLKLFESNGSDKRFSSTFKQNWIHSIWFSGYIWINFSSSLQKRFLNKKKITRFELLGSRGKHYWAGLIAQHARNGLLTRGVQASVDLTTQSSKFQFGSCD